LPRAFCLVIILAVLLIAVIVLQVLINPICPQPGEKVTWLQRFESLKGLLWMAVLFISVFCRMFSAAFLPLRKRRLSVRLFFSLVIMALN
jgi:hypothetical protein